MLQLTGSGIVETLGCDQVISNSQNANCLGTSYGLGSYNYGNNIYPVPIVYWQSYPVYICSDKTAKAVEVLKKLQAKKILTVNSVPKFIELVEEIAAIL